MNKCILFGIFLLSSLGFSIATMLVKTSEAASLAKPIKSSPYSNDNIHEWASKTVLDYGRSENLKGFGPKDIWGSYDLCDALAYKLEVTGRGRNGHPQNTIYKWHGNSQWVPQGLGDQVSDPDLINACAIVLNGAEW